MKILFPVSECVPFAKTGGLADVAQALPKALTQLGHDVSVVMPLYRQVWDSGHQPGRMGMTLLVQVGAQHISAEVWRLRPDADGPWVYFLRYDPFYSRPGLYQSLNAEYPDNDKRFIFLNRGALELGKALDQRWDIVHCHDWHTGLIPLYLKTLYAGEPAYAKVRSLFTIHNLAYQGQFPRETLRSANLPETLFTPEGVEFYGGFNFMKSALMYADGINTVSQTYAREIQSPAFGNRLEGVLQHRRRSLTGIVNGVDYSLWDPGIDPHLEGKYGPDSLGGKQKIKDALQRESGLEPEARAPLFGMVSRLDDQKGLDILARALDELLALDVQLIILGVGSEKYEEMFRACQARFPGRVSLNLEFNDSLAHRIYAGADLFLMPSRFEPCGLGQLVSLRYGTIPVVRQVGGLADTVSNYSEGKGNGFLFKAYTPEALLQAVRRALDVYRNQPAWQDLMRRAMQADFSWTQSAQQYEELYRDLLSSHPYHGLSI